MRMHKVSCPEEVNPSSALLRWRGKRRVPWRDIRVCLATPVPTKWRRVMVACQVVPEEVLGTGLAAQVATRCRRILVALLVVS